MATVTKLKAAVNNKNLPILGSDGKMYSYYVGRWQNAIAELGYTPTSEEIAALKAFINVGINNGWIEKVQYLMPFIGSETNPLQGMVPLIDNVADYELAVNSVDEKLFSYSDGKIRCLGGRSDNNNISARIPVNTSQLGYNQCFSPFVNVTLDTNTVTSGVKGVFAFAQNNDNSERYGFRKGQYDSNFFGYGVKLSGDTETDYKPITSSNMSSPCNVGVFQARFKNDNNEYKLKRYIFVSGEASARRDDMDGNLTGIQLPNSACNIYVGSNASASSLCDANVLSFMDARNLNSSDMYNFNRAVFALVTALGR